MHVCQQTSEQNFPQKNAHTTNYKRRKYTKYDTQIRVILQNTARSVSTNAHTIF